MKPGSFCFKKPNQTNEAEGHPFTSVLSLSLSLWPQRSLSRGTCQLTGPLAENDGRARAQGVAPLPLRTEPARLSGASLPRHCGLLVSVTCLFVCLFVSLVSAQSGTCTVSAVTGLSTFWHQTCVWVHMAVAPGEGTWWLHSLGVPVISARDELAPGQGHSLDTCPRVLSRRAREEGQAWRDLRLVEGSLARVSRPAPGQPPARRGRARPLWVLERSPWGRGAVSGRPPAFPAAGLGPSSFPLVRPRLSFGCTSCLLSRLGFWKSV